MKNDKTTTTSEKWGLGDGFAAANTGSSRTEGVRRSHMHAWWLASGFAAGALLGWVAAAGIMPQSAQTTSHYLHALKKTLAFDLSGLSTSRGDLRLNEELDRYWVSQFVIHRESYDFYTNQTDYDFVSLTAVDPIVNEYLQQYRGEFPKDKLLGDTESTTVKIDSVVVDAEHRIAAVRYTKTTRYSGRPTAEPQQYWAAVVDYEYVRRPMPAAKRPFNPAGFRVVSFTSQPDHHSNVDEYRSSGVENSR